MSAQDYEEVQELINWEDISFSWEIRGGDSSHS